MQLIITGIIIFIALYFLIKSIKKATSGECNCNCKSCSSHCNNYKEKNSLKEDKKK